jgi:large subunit ribosomal protein L21
MKRAVIQTGSKQYLVAEGEQLNVELIKGADKTVTFEPILVIDGEKVNIGAPSLADVTVTADILDADIQEDKTTSIRYKAKKRVKTVKGHRQHKTVIKISKIA